MEGNKSYALIAGRHECRAGERSRRHAVSRDPAHEATSGPNLRAERQEAHSYNRAMVVTGLSLYVHGARDPRWAEPFQRLRDKVARRFAGPVAIAFLEHGVPDLSQAARELAARGVECIRIVPMFFGRGGHLREDFPRRLAAAREAAPSLRFEVTEAAGQSDAVLDALASFAVEAPSLPKSPGSQ